MNEIPPVPELTQLDWRASDMALCRSWHGRHWVRGSCYRISVMIGRIGRPGVRSAPLTAAAEWLITPISSRYHRERNLAIPDEYSRTLLHEWDQHLADLVVSQSVAWGSVCNVTIDHMMAHTFSWPLNIKKSQHFFPFKHSPGPNGPNRLLTPW